MALEGIGPISFGMTSDDVHQVMLELTGDTAGFFHKDGTDYFFDAALEVNYNEDGRVTFIGAQFFTGCGCDFLLYGIDPFDTAAEALFNHIAAKHSRQYHFNPDKVLFHETAITLWNADEQYDYHGGGQRLIFAQIGIGDASYPASMHQQGE